MKIPWILGTALLALALGAGDSAALEIVFDARWDDAGFFSSPERRARLEDAARELTRSLDDRLAALPPDGWSAWIVDPGTGAWRRVGPLAVPADALVVFVGARPLAQTGVAAVAGAGRVEPGCAHVAPAPLQPDFTLGACPPAPGLVFRALFRGSIAARDYPAHDSAPFGGSLSFASDLPWYAGSGAPVPEGRYDLYSAALVQLGRLLGVGTAESWFAQIAGGRFHGAEAVAVNGGPVPLRAGGRDFALASLDRARLGGATPLFGRALAPGERLEATELDVAALRDIGWRYDPWSWAAEEPPRDAAYAGPRMKGDVDGDGRVTRSDLDLLDRLLAGEGDVQIDAETFDAADVHPSHAGFAEGDGRLDASDRERLAEALGAGDPDGDGLSTAIENARNKVWLELVGRPCHTPLAPDAPACDSLYRPGLQVETTLEAFSDRVPVTPGVARELAAGSDTAPLPMGLRRRESGGAPADEAADPRASRGDPSAGGPTASPSPVPFLESIPSPAPGASLRSLPATVSDRGAAGVGAAAVAAPAAARGRVAPAGEPGSPAQDPPVSAALPRSLARSPASAEPAAGAAGPPPGPRGSLAVLQAWLADLLHRLLAWIDALA